MLLVNLILLEMKIWWLMIVRNNLSFIFVENYNKIVAIEILLFYYNKEILLFN